jgi:hypothetical protein
MIQASERAIGVCLGKDGFSKVAGMKSKEDSRSHSQAKGKPEDLKEVALVG